MSTEKHRRLVDILANKTLEGNVEWRRTIDPELFQTMVGKNAVQISQAETPRGVDIQIFIINEDGEIVESFTDVDIEELDATGTSVFFPRMTKLFESARRSATGADKILNDILDRLESRF